MNREPEEDYIGSAAMSEINVTPFIDIMLVLLIIFMVTAPLMMGGVPVNLPKGTGEPLPQPQKPLVVSLDAENRIFIDKEEVLAADRHDKFQKLARGSENGEVLVKGDGAVRYSQMMDLMAALGQAGFARVTLVTDVRSGPKDSEPMPESGPDSDGNISLDAADQGRHEPAETLISPAEE
jgi:biopolymer transport protein TolR